MDERQDVSLDVSWNVSLDELSESTSATDARRAHKAPRLQANGKHARGRPGRYLLRSGSVYLFQIRMPPDLAGGSCRTIRMSLGPLTAREAKRQADLLGALARNRFDQIRAERMERQTDAAGPDEQQLFDGGTPEMTAAEIKGYLKAMRQVISQPAPPVPAEQQSYMAGLKGLVLINRELAKGAEGNPLVLEHAELLKAQSIARMAEDDAAPEDVGAGRGDPDGSLPQATKAPAPEPRIEAPAPSEVAARAADGERTPAFKLDRRYVPRKPSDKPLFSEVAEEYFADREVTSGRNNKDIRTARFRAALFIELIGDHRIDTYTAADLQAFIYLLTHWPSSPKDRPEGKAAREILADNADLAAKPLTLNALRNGYVAAVKSIFNSRTTAYEYDYPFEKAKLRYPGTAAAAQSVEPISDERLNAIFRIGVSRGLLDEAVLPLLGVLTSRRLGLLVHLQGNDFREKYPGIWVAQTSGIKLMGDGGWRRIPIKTEASTTFFVMHDFLREIGFTQWAAGLGDRFLFPELIRLADPSKSASQYMRRLFHRAGVDSAGKEVFHSLRGAGIEQMRDTKVDARDRRLQAGHKLESEHDLYGFRAISEVRAKELAFAPLREGLDFSVFRGLDFHRLAKAKRTMGRRPKK